MLCAWSLGSESLLPFIGLGLTVSNVEVIFPLSLCLQFYLATTRWRVNTYLAFPQACGYWVKFKCVVCVGTYLRTEGGRRGAVNLEDASCVWLKMKYSETSSPEFRQGKIPPGSSFHTSNDIRERWVPFLWYLFGSYWKMRSIFYNLRPLEDPESQLPNPECASRSVMSNSLQLHGLSPARLL